MTESPTPGGNRSKESGTQELHDADAVESELEPHFTSGWSDPSMLTIVNMHH